MKLYVESVLADRFLAFETAADLFVLADSYSCALLKEMATHYIIGNSDAVLKTSGWFQIKDSMRLQAELVRQKNEKLRGRYKKKEIGLRCRQNGCDSSPYCPRSGESEIGRKFRDPCGTMEEDEWEKR